MAGKEIAVKKFVVKFSAERKLETLTLAGKSSAQLLTSARILPEADALEAGEGWSDSAISASPDTRINNVGRTRRQLVGEGFDGASEGIARWRLRLLEEKVVELNKVQKVSDNTIGRT